jgi:hypothetical protein
MSHCCQRCYAIFDGLEALNSHTRSTEVCTLKELRSIEGFDQDQEAALRDKGRMHQAGSEEEKWKIVYSILFPETAFDDMPSPCE